MRRWRLTTWLILAWCAIGAVWLNSLGNEGGSACSGLQGTAGSTCTDTVSYVLLHRFWPWIVVLVLVFLARMVGSGVRSATRRRCGACGAAVADDAAMCRTCGASLPTREQEKSAHAEVADERRRALELHQREQAASRMTKVCPECAEEVKSAAAKCRFCGYRFDRSTEQSSTEVRRSP